MTHIAPVVARPSAAGRHLPELRAEVVPAAAGICGGVGWREPAVQNARVGGNHPFCPSGIRRADTTMKRTIAIVTLAVVGLITAGPAIAQQRPQSPVGLRGQRQAQPQGKRQAPPTRPMYQRRDTWYEFLLKQFNPSNFDYGAWIEQRRQVFLDASVRNPYFKYSLGTTIALLIMAMLYTKQWIDHRRAMWITAEMMTDLYNHDLYSRDVAEKAIQKYNQHIERCNRAIEAAQHGSALPAATTDTDQLNAQLQKTAGELNVASTENAALQEQLTQKSNVIVELSLRADALLKKNGGNLASSQPIDLSGAEPKLIKLINDLQEQLVVERKKNRQLKGA